MCDYCSEKTWIKPITSNPKYGQISVEFDRKHRSMCVWEDNAVIAEIEVEYCPICGRKIAKTGDTNLEQN